jgi:hypothetical protein
MTTTLDDIYRQALQLPDDSKESLAERLVTYLETHVDPDLESDLFREAKRRRDEVRSGEVASLDGDAVLAEARRIVEG